ncbi:BMP family ABC transporter substrate-binding protein [Salinibacterium sp. SYSU T00001]|uniref:BMP family lipoprotein n=1 Tax=Homoserinimonas sedimenticola TaxID=2986805 RepID=UPI002235A648|nr:BMP family ABC transporter substrate-binding protein [Salinibacterium sedimenticola]MCW4385109.1 BMP family ABC transporter substrate-binding protein [Salinibacterium sedimenticola]
MKTISRKAALSGLALIGTSALVLTGCASAPEDDGGNEGEAIDFLPCMVSDEGGFDDKSFNQLGFEGMVQAADELGVEYNEVESNAETDYAPNLTNLVDQGCDVIVTVGFALAEAASESAGANPDVNYISIDDTVDTDFDGETDHENIKPLVYDTAQAAFLGGYAAAATSQTGVVGTFGGQPFPTVTIFMDGFKQGVEYYNEVNGTSVSVLGWDGENGSFTGGFAAGTEAQTIAQGLIDQNADVILPVGGPIYQSAAAAIRDSDRDIALIGVDADVYETDPSVGDLLLTSIRKGMDVSVYEAVLAAGEGDFSNEAYVGTLENGGVSLAEFHDWESKVPAGLWDELESLKEQIISGEVTVESYLAG